GRKSSHLTVVYGLNTLHARRNLWRDLGNLSVGTPWILIIDLNFVLSSQDRMNGNPVSNCETQDFEAFFTNAALYEVPSSGCFFSWSNKGEGLNRIASRNDRCLANCSWFFSNPLVKTMYFMPDISDHSPLVLDYLLVIIGGVRPFRFLNIIVDHPQFLEVIQSNWSNMNQRTAGLSV
ncbi:hypothetical protein RDABS01_003599, partial [Bienertia sinuspersici]